MIWAFPWAVLARKILPWAIGAAILGGLIWEFNRRGDKVEALEAAGKAAEAQLETERANHVQTVQAYQAGLAAATAVANRRIEVTARLQKIESEIANAPVTTSCADSPAMRLAVGELRDKAATDPAR